MTSTTSRVLMSSDLAQPEREMLRKWAEWAAENGGSFSIKQEWTEGHWCSTFVINWPDAPPAGDEQEG